MKKINILYFAWDNNKYHLCERFKHSIKDQDKLFNNLDELLKYLEEKYHSRNIEISLDKDFPEEEKNFIEKNIKEKFKKATISEYH